MQAYQERRPTAALALDDGTVFAGRGFGAQGVALGELVFNTAMTGYQEILTDPSYAGQIVTFTFPHIGNVGANFEDHEAATPHLRGLVTRAAVTAPSNWRSQGSLAGWLERQNIIGIGGVDTRRLTSILREQGAKNAAIAHDPEGRLDIDELIARARAWPGLVGMDLAKDVTTTQRHGWEEGPWSFPGGFAEGTADGPHIVVVDYGVKRNILRELAGLGCRITVLPASATAAEITALAPDGVLLANGPGDPAATGEYAVPAIRELVENDIPIFGICLGHQLLGLALGGRTEKMAHGHHGANHPVKDLLTGKVEITSQNHGFAIADGDLPDTVEVTHRSLFDGTIQGIRLKDRPVFSVQYHPEASPGPKDSHYLFERFIEQVRARAG